MTEQTERIRISERVAQVKPQKDLSLSAQVVAVLVFLLGVALLVAVFLWTRDFFESLAEANQQWLKRPVDPSDSVGLAGYMPDLIALSIRVVLLFVLGYLGSSIATKGAQLFAATLRKRDSSSAGPTDLP